MARSATAIQSDLDAFYALRTKAATNGGIASYQIDTGQGRQQAAMISLSEINKTIATLEEELAEASGSFDNVSVRFAR